MNTAHARAFRAKGVVVGVAIMTGLWLGLTAPTITPIAPPPPPAPASVITIAPSIVAGGR